MNNESEEKPVVPDWGPEMLRRKDFGTLLLSCLKAEAVYSKGSFVVALTAPFGSGKTHFLNAWVADLRARREGGEKGIPRVVHINAWDTDFSGEPLLAIIATVLKQLESSTVMQNQKNLDDLKTAAWGLLGAGTQLVKDLAVGYVEEKTGLALETSIAVVAEGSPADKLERKATKLLEDFETRQRCLRGFKAALGKLINHDNEESIFFVVDELDRCKPTYAIEFLEAIKHVFDVRGLGVLLAVDWDQLNSTATTLFGGGSDSEEYLRKFIQRRAELPLPDLEQTEALSRHIIDKFFASGDPKQPLADNLRGLLTSIIRAVGLSARQIETAAYAFARIYFHKGLKEGERIDLNQRIVLVPEMFLTCIYAKDRKIFELLREGVDLDQCMDALKSMKLESKVGGGRPNFILGRILAGLATQNNWDSFMARVDKIWPEYKIYQDRREVRNMFGVDYLPSDKHCYYGIGRDVMQLNSIVRPF